MGGSRSKRDQGCMESGQTTPSWKAAAVIECEQLYSYADARCQGGALHRMSAFRVFWSKWPCAVILVFCSTLLTLLWSLVAWIPPSALLFSPRKQLSSAFWQADKACLNCSGLFGECACIHYVGCSLVSTFRNETQVSSPVTRTTWLRIHRDLSGIALKGQSQSRSHSMPFVGTLGIFGTHLVRNLW
jgi:hypothetical protein